MSQEQFQISEWKPGALFYSIWIGVTFTTLMVDLFILQGNTISFPYKGLDWLVVTIVFLAWLVLVPFLQYLIVSRTDGIRPKFKILSTQKKVRAFNSLETNHRLRKSTFSSTLAVPIMVAWVLMPLLVVLTPSSSHSIMFAAAVGMIVGASFKDLWYLVMTIRKPEGTLVEELGRAGVRFYEPSSSLR